MPTTYYLWDFANDSYLMAKDGAGATTAVYTNEPVQYGKLISQRSGNATAYYHVDAQQSTRQMTDQNQNVTDEYTYSAFGEIVAESGSTMTRLRFHGALGYYHTVETNAYYVRERILIPSTGRWLSFDGFGIGSDSTANLYRYVLNRPINSVDPSGRLALPPPGRCNIAVECTPAAGSGPDIPGIGLHCGIVMTYYDSNGNPVTTHQHSIGIFDPEGLGCKIRNQQGGGGGTYTEYFVGTFSVTACRCLIREQQSINRAMDGGWNKYRPRMPEYECGEPPSCNSNYAASCLLRRCSINFAPPGNVIGWGKRMRQCMTVTYELVVIFAPKPGCARRCRCVLWKNVDSAWCAPSGMP